MSDFLPGDPDLARPKPTASSPPPQERPERSTTVVMLTPGHPAEDEFAWLQERLPGVRFPVEHTSQGPARADVEELRSLGAHDRLVPVATRARLVHRPDAMMWASTSASFVHGARGMDRQAKWISDAARVPASSTSLAFLEALRALRITRVAVASTYPPAVTGHFVNLLCEEGYQVSSCTSHRLPSGEAAAALEPDAVWRLIGERYPAAVQAVLIPNTALHTLPLIEELENGLDKVVLTANQVSAWRGLRLAGWHGHPEGLGRLFL